MIHSQNQTNQKQALHNNFITNNIMGGKINFSFDSRTGYIMYKITCDAHKQFLVMCRKLKTFSSVSKRKWTPLILEIYQLSC